MHHSPPTLLPLLPLLILILILLHPTLSLYDTVLVGPTTYLSLRIGQFKKITLPFSFQTYYSVTTGKPPNLPFSPSICSVQQQQFSLTEHSFLLINNKKSTGYKDIVTDYNVLVEKRFLIDMMVLGDVLVVVYSDSVKIVELDRDGVSVGVLGKEFSLEEKVSGGKMLGLGDGNQSLYFVSTGVVYEITRTAVQRMAGYSVQEDFQSAVVLDEGVLLVASRRSGVQIYTRSAEQPNTLNLLSTLDTNYFGQPLDIADIATDEAKQTVYILTRHKSIHQLTFNSTAPFSSSKQTHPLNRSGCQNMEYANERLYITCPQLHILTFSASAFTSKTFDNPNFNPKSIIFFNSIIILVGHNLAKIYYNNVELGYYHDFLMRKLLPIPFNKILIGSDYGISLTTWNISELEIVCGLKRKGLTEKYEGKISTTIDVIAECNEEYFKENNISYKEEFKNDVCLYHFPIGVDFWVGKEIDYLAFKVGVGGILLVCVGVLVAWGVMNRRVRVLVEAIKNYSALGQGHSDTNGDAVGNKGAYVNMVEEEGNRAGGKSDRSPTEEDAQKELHEIGD